MFGADLTEEMSRTHSEAPAVVIKCVEEIEKAVSDHGKSRICCRETCKRVMEGGGGKKHLHF